MKTTRLIPIAIALLPVAVWAAERPGFIDLDAIIAKATAQPTVNVNLPSFLLAELADGLAGDPNHPLIAAGFDVDRLINDVRSIRLAVFENMATADLELQKAVQTLTADLNANWVSMVSVPSENVGIYITSDPATNRMAGLAIVVAQGDTVVLGNIEGRVPIGTILQMAARSNALPKELLQSIMESGKASQADPAAAPEPPQPPSE